MFKKFICWIGVLALAYLATYLKITTLTVAFFALHAGLIAAVIIALLISCMFGKEQALMKVGHLLICMLRLAGGTLVVCGAAYLAKRFLLVDFFSAYMLLTFGQCLCYKAFTPNNYTKLPKTEERGDEFDTPADNI